MTTYNELVERIETATEQLESDVAALNDFVRDSEGVVADSVAAASQAALDASESALLAQQEADKAENIRIQTQEIKDSINDFVEEAPETGVVYGRKDGLWVPVESGGGSGGSVHSVNGVGPDEQGNVVIPIPTPPTKVSELENDEGFVKSSELTAGVEEAPEDGKSYVRKDGGWVENTSGGGGGNEWSEYSVKYNTTTSYKFSVNKPLFDAYNAQVGTNEWQWFTDANAPDFGDSPDTLFWLSIQSGFDEGVAPPPNGLPNTVINIDALKVEKWVNESLGETWEPDIEKEFIPSIGDLRWTVSHTWSGLLPLLLDSTEEAVQLRDCMLGGVWKFETPNLNPPAPFPVEIKNQEAYLIVRKNSPTSSFVSLLIPSVGGCWLWDSANTTWKQSVVAP